MEPRQSASSPPNGSVEKAEVHRVATAPSPVGSGDAQRTPWLPSAGPTPGLNIALQWVGTAAGYRMRLL